MAALLSLQLLWWVSGRMEGKPFAGVALGWVAGHNHRHSPLAYGLRAFAFLVLVIVNWAVGRKLSSSTFVVSIRANVPTLSTIAVVAAAAAAATAAVVVVVARRRRASLDTSGTLSSR